MQGATSGESPELVAAGLPQASSARTAAAGVDPPGKDQVGDAGAELALAEPAPAPTGLQASSTPPPGEVSGLRQEPPAYAGVMPGEMTPRWDASPGEAALGDGGELRDPPAALGLEAADAGR